MLIKDRSRLFSASAYLALTGLVLILFSGAAFMHMHRKADGQIIIHSHANHQSNSDENNPSAPDGHRHSNVEYYFYQATSDFDKFIIIIPDNKPTPPLNEEFLLFSDLHHATQQCTHNYFLRAPPPLF